MEEPFDHDWWTRATCRAHYSYLDDTAPTARTIWCTATVVVFAVLLDVFANVDELRRGCGKRRIKLPDNTTSYGSFGDSSVYSSNHPRSELVQHMSPSRVAGVQDNGSATRAQSLFTSKPLRLSIATFLFLPALIAFSIRILDATAEPELREECRSVIQPDRPNWALIWLVTIAPFANASFAFWHAIRKARAVQHRTDSGLHGDAEGCVWLPGALFAGATAVVFTVVAHFAVTARSKSGKADKLRLGRYWDHRETAAAYNDVEMQGEAAVSLMKDIGG